MGDANPENEQPAKSQRLTWLGWLVLLLSMGLGATALSSEWQPNPLGMALGFALLLALVVAGWRIPRRLRGVQAAWILPAYAHAWSDISTGATLTANRSTPPVDLEAWLLRHRRFEPLARLAGLGKQPVRISWVSRFTKRGANELPPLFIRCTQPFGLFSVSVNVSAATELMVFPALGKLHGDFQARLQRWLEANATASDAGDDEVARLRDYRPGDHPRSIHWRASARRRSLQVVERHANTSRCVALVVDTTAGVSGVDAAKLEKLLSVAATLVDHLCRSGWAVSLYGHFAPQGLYADRQILMETLALATSHAGSLTEVIPQNRASLVLSQKPVEALDTKMIPANAMVLSLAECEVFIDIPNHVR